MCFVFMCNRVAKKRRFCNTLCVKTKKKTTDCPVVTKWRREAELDRCTRFCRPLPNRSAITPEDDVWLPGNRQAVEKRPLGLLGLGNAGFDALVVAHAAFTFQAFAKLLSHNGE